MERETVFKIQRRDGLFSTGGNPPGFTAKGKAWGTLSGLKCHLRQFVITRKKFKTYSAFANDRREVFVGVKPGETYEQYVERRLRPYADCTIVEYEVVEKFNNDETVEDWVLQQMESK